MPIWHRYGPQEAAALLSGEHGELAYCAAAVNATKQGVREDEEMSPAAPSSGVAMALNWAAGPRAEGAMSFFRSRDELLGRNLSLGWTLHLGRAKSQPRSG